MATLQRFSYDLSLIATHRLLRSVQQHRVTLAALHGRSTARSLNLQALLQDEITAFEAELRQRGHDLAPCA